MITACTEPIVEVQVDGIRCPSTFSAFRLACEDVGVMNGWDGMGPSHDTLPLALVIESQGALIASWIAISWSIRFRVMFKTELMIVAPPGD